MIDELQDNNQIHNCQVHYQNWTGRGWFVAWIGNVQNRQICDYADFEQIDKLSSKKT